MWGERCRYPLHPKGTRTIPTRVGRTQTTSSTEPQGADHPHACGENFPDSTVKRHADGPSPRVWGEPPAFQELHKGRRTIPTRVGRTGAGALIFQPCSDHPHACGENCWSGRRSFRASGPSPRVWGERVSVCPVSATCRTIPTRVGRTAPLLCFACMMTDHPHACGENWNAFWQGKAVRGPSPRVWGELDEERVLELIRRTIPTRVGRTKAPRDVPLQLTDHPHACGENSKPCTGFCLHYGPSPRVWGEPRNKKGEGQPSRTIPTRVGRTRPFRGGKRHAADHPHACGENVHGGGMLSVENGPSPRVWGERQVAPEEVTRRRTIPTRVGRTLWVRSEKPCTTDHPHACGENESVELRIWQYGGPSPRVWGERPVPGYKHGRNRTIPTRVGRTRALS